MGKKIKLKKKKKRKFKKIVFMIIIYLSFSYTFYYMVKDNKMVTNEEFINILVSSGNANILNKYKATSVINGTMKFFLNIDFTNPISIFNASVLRYGYVNKTKDKETISISYNDDYSDMNELKKVSDYIRDPNPREINNPVLYLYNSHQLENYNSGELNIYGITPNVLMLSYIIREKLDKLGVSTVVEDANMSSILEKNKWDYSYSYKVSRELMLSKMKKYSSLKYYIDIHRDSVNRDISTIKIGNKDYAKILFVVGQDYSTWQNNYNFAVKLNNIIDNNYKGLSRGIIKKTGINVNGVYNQDVSYNCILIEVGGYQNTIDEVYNTAGILADVLNKYIVENK